MVEPAETGEPAEPQRWLSLPNPAVVEPAETGEPAETLAPKFPNNLSETAQVFCSAGL